ncbi:MAG: ATP-dependent Clp protease adaptor ClpS [Bacteroidales bacterium]|jgi:ATP-dependent Clp protease adaptor protein ClpS|nr:ATP-dependent Clp protease adaptor ClpS [Bacteroidales bacterium]
MEKSKTHTQSEEEIATLNDEGCKLLLYNDDVHTFDYVIKALVDICRHTVNQAEQCAIIVHCKGKCVIKNGSYETLLPMHTSLLDKQLTTEIVQ